MINFKKKFQDTDTRQNMLVLFVILTGFLFGAASMFWVQSNVMPKTFLGLEGVASDVNVKALLETPQGIRPLSIDENPKIIPPYRLTAELKNALNQYRDIGFTVDKDGNKIAVMGDGFEPSQKITMTINDKKVFDGIAMDWSGRIELESVLPPSGPAHVCLSFKETPPLDICHLVAGRRTI